MKSIAIIFLFFCLTLQAGKAEHKYKQIDLYTETYFYKDNKEYQVKRLNWEQKKN